MPEMPEVETIKRIIEPQIIKQRIVSLTINNPQVIAHPEEHIFTELLLGQTVQSMSRKGKYLTIHFENSDRLVLHLRMTGQLLITPTDYPVEKHTHLIADLSGGKQMRYIDVRRFGRFWYLKADENDNITGQDKLGIEPLDDNLTGMYLKVHMGNRKKVIKEMLHDQSIVSGIGNIYSDEILYASGIYPKEKCIDLNTNDWNNLADKIKNIIAWGIETNKITPEEYLKGKGKEYRNIPHLRVYGREGQPCIQCQSIIEKVIISGRSSCYCPKCQRKKV